MPAWCWWALRDLRAGAGWGVIDALGLPKAPWYGLARASRPVGLLLTDEGLNGLALHLVNDGGDDVVGEVDVGVYSADHRIDQATRSRVEVPARGGARLPAEDLFDGFRDLTYAYRFGPRTTELIVARLRGTGRCRPGHRHLPAGRPESSGPCRSRASGHPRTGR